jgi:uncharacterized protein
MGNIKDKVTSDMKVAMREKRADELSVLRMLLAAIKNRQIEVASASHELTDEQETEVVKNEIKKRKDAIEMYEQGGREDLAAKERGEIAFLTQFMPEQMGEDEIERIVRETVGEMGEVNMADFGKVMGQVMSRVKGKADGEVVRDTVKKVLSEK